MADEFKPGDIVQLKSGGPAMTIDGKNNYNKIHMIVLGLEALRGKMGCLSLKP